MITDLFIIGSQKCGTTSLAKWLNQHPNLSLCSDKEPSYFSIKFNDLSEIDYHNLFHEKEKKNKLFFEASTSYTNYPLFPEVPKRIFEYNKNAKFIYIVRDPIERIKSHYRHNWIKGYTRKNFIDEVLKNSEYLFFSSYGLQLRQYLNYFPIERIYITSLEKLLDNKIEELNNIFDFLGIKNLKNKDINFYPENVSSKVSQLPVIYKYFRFIYKYFNPNIKRFFKKILSIKPNYKLNSSKKFDAILKETLAEDKEEFEKISGNNLYEV